MYAATDGGQDRTHSRIRAWKSAAEKVGEVCNPVSVCGLPVLCEEYLELHACLTHQNTVSE
jgi:hypothetical protein